MATDQRVVIGMDPHKRSVTIEAMTTDEGVLGGGRFGTDVDGFTAMTDYGKQWPDRIWAIEGCSGGTGAKPVHDAFSAGQTMCLEPPVGIEPTTYSLRVNRSTD